MFNITNVFVANWHSLNLVNIIFKSKFNTFKNIIISKIIFNVKKNI